MSNKTGEDGESIVKKLERYFYEDDSFAQIFEDFAFKNCHKIDLDTDECKLECVRLFSFPITLCTTPLSWVNNY